MSTARVAIVNPQTLLGKELQESLEDRLAPEVQLELFTTESDEESLLTEVQGAAGLIQPWNESSLEGVTLAFLCGFAASHAQVREALPADCTAIVIAPDAGVEIGRPVVSGVNDQGLTASGVYLSPHPGAIALAHLLNALSPLDLQRAAATVAQPTSIYDEAGLEGLFEETRALLSFRERPGDSPFAAQVAFNLVPAAPGMPSLRAILHEVLGEVPVAVHLLQAGSFHGLAVSLFVELAKSTDRHEVDSALSKSPAIDSVDDHHLLGPVATANRSELLVGPAQPAGAAGFFWIWAALDNLTRGGALNALETGAALFPALLR